MLAFHRYDVFRNVVSRKRTVLDSTGDVLCRVVRGLECYRSTTL